MWLLDEASDEPKVLTASDITHVVTCGSQVVISTTTHILKWRAGDEPNTLQLLETEGTFFCHGALFVVSSEVQPLNTLLVTIVEYGDDNKPRNNAVRCTLRLRDDGRSPITFDVRRIDKSETYISIGWLLSDDICKLLLYNAAARQFSERSFPKQRDWFSKLQDEVHIWGSSIYTVFFKSTPKNDGSIIHSPIQCTTEDDRIFGFHYTSARLEHKAWDDDYSKRKICGDSDYLVLFAEQGYLVLSSKNLPCKDCLELNYLAYEI